MRDAPERKSWKMKLVRMLYGRDYDRKKVMELFRFIDWLLVLPEDLDIEFLGELRLLEEEKKMPYITSVERIGIKKGMEQGIQAGIQQGIEQGSLRESRQMVIEAVAARFGVTPEDVVSAVFAIQARETLRSLLHQAIQCNSLDDFRKKLHQAQGVGGEKE